MIDIYCQGLKGRPVRVADEDILPDLVAFMDQWPHQVRPAKSGRSSLIQIQRQSDGSYQISAPWLSAPLTEKNLTRLFCSLSVDLATACLQADPKLIGLHAAALDFHGRLVIFPNVNRAGKSLLAAGLMAAGRRSFGDDLIALTPSGRVRSFGLPPRLRLPLPALPEPMRSFINRRLLFADHHYGFLKSDGEHQAHYEQEGAIGAVVLLNRQKSGPARLSAVAAETGLENLLNRCLLLSSGQALPALERAQKIIDHCLVRRLTYSSLPEAVELLIETFTASRPWTSDPVDTEPDKWDEPAERPGLGLSAGIPTLIPDQLYRRNERVISRKVSDGLFLVEPAEDLIFHLNHIGRLIWDLLAEPLSRAEAIDLLESAFPDLARETIAGDIMNLFEDLISDGLIRPV